MMANRHAGVYTTRSLGELDETVRNLSQQGYRIVAVFETPGDMYNVVAQEEFTPPKPELPRFYGTVPRD